MLSEKSDSTMFLSALTCFLFIACCLISGKTIGESGNHAIGAIVEREEAPGTYWTTLGLMTVLGIN